MLNHGRFCSIKTSIVIGVSGNVATLISKNILLKFRSQVSRPITEVAEEIREMLRPWIVYPVQAQDYNTNEDEGAV